METGRTAGGAGGFKKLKKKNTAWTTVILVLILVAGGVALSRDSSPLLERGRRNPVAGLYDRLAFTWHFTRATFLDENADREKSLAELARAVWHRPSFSREVFNLDPADYLGLARQFESLGLKRKAARLFLAAYRADPGRERALTCILGCAGLGDWEKVALIAAESVGQPDDFAAGYYWWGRALYHRSRPEEAEEKFLQAKLVNPEAGDIDYWLGRVCQDQNRREEAAAFYREMIAAAPGHREAWEALAVLERAAGNRPAAEAAEERASSLTAGAAADSRFGERFLFLGWDGLPSPGQGEKAFPFTLYCRFRPGTAGRITPYLRLQAGHFQKKIRLEPISSREAARGETLVKTSRPVLPWDTVPLPAEVRIGFLDENEQPLRIFNRRDFELKLGEVEIEPALFSYPGPDPIISGLPWKDAADLKVRTVLAGDNEMEVELAGSGPVSAVGIISYTVGTISLPQETEIGTLGGWGPGGAEFEYPIRLGMETADRWLESRPPHVRRHQAGEIVYSRRVEGERDFQWHFYLELFLVPVPGPLEKLVLRYTGPAGGCWMVRNIFLLSEEDLLPDPE